MALLALAIVILGALVVVLTPLVAFNLLQIWPVVWIYAAGVAGYGLILWRYIRWRRRGRRS